MFLFHGHECFFVLDINFVIISFFFFFFFFFLNKNLFSDSTTSFVAMFKNFQK
jgi:hypothetical protein